MINENQIQIISDKEKLARIVIESKIRSCYNHLFNINKLNYEKSQYVINNGIDELIKDIQVIKYCIKLIDRIRLTENINLKLKEGKI